MASVGCGFKLRPILDFTTGRRYIVVSIRTEV